MVEEIANSEVDAFIEKGMGSGAYVPWHFILQKPSATRPPPRCRGGCGPREEEVGACQGGLKGAFGV